jgi:hypothetical protein
VSDFGGRSVSIVTVPMLRRGRAGDGVASFPIPICAAVHASSPCAAEGLRVMPFGERDVDVFDVGGVDFAFSQRSAETFTTVVAPSGWSDTRRVSGVTDAVGLKGTLPQPSTPTGVCVSVLEISPA